MTEPRPIDLEVLEGLLEVLCQSLARQNDRMLVHRALQDSEMAVRDAMPNTPTTNAHCAVVAPALILVTCVVYAKAPVVPMNAGEPRIPGPLYDPLALWERVRVRVRGVGNATKCN